jgi:hypothetical protein
MTIMKLHVSDIVRATQEGLQMCSPASVSQMNDQAMTVISKEDAQPSFLRMDITSNNGETVFDLIVLTTPSEYRMLSISRKELQSMHTPPTIWFKFRDGV